MDQHIVVTGNPIDGFKFFGPFETVEDAIEWAANGGVAWATSKDQDWWTAPLGATEGW